MIKKTPKKNITQKIKNIFYRHPKNRDEILHFLRHAKGQGILELEALRMIEGVLQVSEMQVRDVMVQRSQMIVVEGDASPETAIPLLVETAHSRFPVIGDSRDEIVGILLAKDILRILGNLTDTKLKIRDLVRPATFIPESKRLNVLLKEFRINRNHMAIVVDEYGGVAGLVTIEDVLEQIVGDIEDEYDLAEEPNILKIKNTEFVVKALTPLEEFNQYFNTSYFNESYETIGGLVLQQFSHLPKRGESTTFDRFKFTVIQANPRGIQLLRVTQLENKP